jgi:L-seryl-tRNA(Ser) seleniumtransferase
MKQKSQSLRGIPSVDKILRELVEHDLPRPALVALIRRELEKIRREKKPADALARIRAAIENLRRDRIQPIINGTGIIVHTNFGRSPLSERAVKSLTDAASFYTNLEYDLSGGERGVRAAYLEHNLAVLCGAQAATVVNNCAAALVLILRHFTSDRSRRDVVISRGELVQIGGGFRIPQILQSSGAKLREVGTTNKTSLDDYRKAIDEKTAMVLRVHRSNFFMEGFVASPSVQQLSQVCAKVPLVVDLGSGAVFDTTPLGGEKEPTPAETMRHGADLLCFSGDKLLGGPQAGIIAGRAKHISALKNEPLFRALRCDKLVLSALQATVDLHLRDEVIEILDMANLPVAILEQRAAQIRQALNEMTSMGSGELLNVTIGQGKSQIGGGSLPRTQIPSVTIELQSPSIRPEELAARLRAARPAVIGYIAENRLKIDLRTVFFEQDSVLISAIKSIA